MRFSGAVFEQDAWVPARAAASRVARQHALGHTVAERGVSKGGMTGWLAGP